LLGDFQLLGINYDQFAGSATRQQRLHAVRRSRITLCSQIASIPARKSRTGYRI
jgi:hypothetical protein